MTPSFGQSLEEFGVRFLLISGQATVLYEAADFSEDLDLWVEPSAANVARLVSALRASSARYYKLTPRLNEENMRRGHGFHFVVGRESEFYLDVMGQPPRVGAFLDAFAKRHVFETDWGNLPVVGLKDLVEIKKTQRLRDYGIISQLALRWVERSEFSATPEEVAWVVEHLFSVSELEDFAKARPDLIEVIAPGDLKELTTAYAHGESPTSIEAQVEAAMHERMSALQRSDREYWKDIIAELRLMRTAGTLLSEGEAV